MAFLNPDLQFKDHQWKWIFLRLASLIYEVVIRCWLRWYRLGFNSSVSVSIPVISVGNISVGGTGKTPLIDWLLGYFENYGQKVAVLTRGYKARRKHRFQILDRTTGGKKGWDQFGDEPWWLWKNHPEIRIHISPDRVGAALEAQKDANVLLLDDGMQHLRLVRSLNIVLIDTSSGFGNGHILPLGPLREPLEGLARADVILYTKSNLARRDKNPKRIVRSIAPEVPQYNCDYVPLHLISSVKDRIIPLSEIEKKSCVLFSGIGNPEAFDSVVKKLDVRIIEHLMLPDHFHYGKKSLNRLFAFFNRHCCDFTICTEKDWVKLERWQKELPEIFRLKMAVRPDPMFVDFLDSFREGVCGNPLDLDGRVDPK